MKRLESTVVVFGVTNYIFPQLVGKEIITVEVDGYGMSKLITSGTPKDKEVKIQVIGQTRMLVFPAPLARGSEIIVKYKD